MIRFSPSSLLPCHERKKTKMKTISSFLLVKGRISLFLFLPPQASKNLISVLSSSCGCGGERERRGRELSILPAHARRRRRQTQGRNRRGGKSSSSVFPYGISRVARRRRRRLETIFCSGLFAFPFWMEDPAQLTNLAAFDGYANWEEIRSFLSSPPSWAFPYTVLKSGK